MLTHNTLTIATSPRTLTLFLYITQAVQTL